MQLTERTMLTKGTVMQIKKLQKNVCLLIYLKCIPKVSYPRYLYFCCGVSREVCYILKRLAAQFLHCLFCL